MSLRIEKSELPYPAEFFWLLALVFFLPLFEAPKNICWLGYLLTWLYNRIRRRDWGGPWDRWDSLIALWIASGYVVAAFAGIRGDEWGDATDLLRYGSVLWLAKRSHYRERALLSILGTLIAATLIALAWGYWEMYGGKTTATLGLNSVGHVNHSAIYLAIAFGASLSFLVSYMGRVGHAVSLLSSLATGVLIVSVFVTESRAAIGAAAAFAVIFAGVLGARKRTGAVKGTLIALLGMAVILAVKPGVLDKTLDKTEQGLAFSYRDKIWSNGLVQWRQFPLFGVGMGNFGHASLDQLREWNKPRSWNIQPTADGLQAHGHSLYLTTLAERGLVGFAILFAVLFAWAVALAKSLPRVQDTPLDWTLFGAALAGWLVTVAVGLVNTTLHHEHGILAALLLGLWLGRRTVSDPTAQRAP